MGQFMSSRNEMQEQINDAATVDEIDPTLILAAQRVLKQLEHDEQNLFDLEEYDLQDQVIRVLPPLSLAYLVHIRILRLSGNDLTEIPFSFGTQLSQLTHLYLDHNRLSCLPLSFQALRSLAHLDLSDNQLSGLYDNFCDLHALSHLWLQHNKLRDLPLEFGQLGRLCQLDLSVNRLRDLPETFHHLVELRFVNLCDNRLASLPEKIGQLTKLETLRVSNNVLVAIPLSTDKCQALTTLDVDQNRLGALPPNLPPSVRNLNLHQNRLSRFPAQALANLAKLEILSYGQNKLKDVPKDLLTCHHMLDLDLSENGLQSLPSRGWKSLSSLTSLMLNNNALETLPASIFTLPSLVQLHLHHNKLIELPGQLARNAKTTSRPSRLERLTLNHNAALKQLPDSIKFLVSLRYFNVELTDMENLPRSIVELKHVYRFVMDKRLFVVLNPYMIQWCNALPHFIVLGQN